MTAWAARRGDHHVCPLMDGPTPHMGGPIMPPCAVRVLTENQPQARMTDLASCLGPPDFIATGAATVLVQGLPAARHGDMTSHGGAIMFGCPTVLIGGASAGARSMAREYNSSTSTWETRYGTSISVVEDPYDPVFVSRAAAALIRLDITPAGKQVFDALESSGNRITISPLVSAPDSSISQIPWSPDVQGADLVLGRALISAANHALGEPRLRDEDLVEDYRRRGLLSTTG
jgi:uncharacterized Zn-binding protein involved in type VI secretion